MTKPSQISAGSTLGMIAGGQIGGFFSEAALRMGYKVAVSVSYTHLTLPTKA